MKEKLKTKAQYTKSHGKKFKSFVPEFALVCLFLFLIFGHTSISFAGIFNKLVYSDGNRRPSLTYEEDRRIKGHRSRTETLSFRLSLYGKPGRNLPLLVQVHEWGGSFSRQEELASYTNRNYNFVMLYFQYKPSSNNQDDWWFGTHWDGVCRMWAHEAVMAIVKQVISGNIIRTKLRGTTIDPNRVYLFGHSIGGTGAYQLGVRHPEVFAAIHAHAGLGRFTPPVGILKSWFETHIVGTLRQRIRLLAPNNRYYQARDYSNLAWYLANYRNPAWETPFVSMTHGTGDSVVPSASGGDLLREIMDQQKRGFFYHRHTGQHSDNCFVQLNWMWNFRKNQSFLAFTRRRGYGIGVNQAINPYLWDGYVSGGINDLYKLSWDAKSIVDTTTTYSVTLVGRGTADVTLRRLQRFKVRKGAWYSYWIGSKTGAGKRVKADSNGLLTIPDLRGGNKLIIAQKGSTPKITRVWGYVRDRRGRPVSGVKLVFSRNGGRVTTDRKGRYIKNFSRAYKGTVTPFRTCRRFRPYNRYINLGVGRILRRDFRMYNGVVVYGKITKNNTPLANVLVGFSNRGKSARTNSKGFYSRILRCNWYGRIRPYRNRTSFTPTTRRLGRVRKSLTRVNFVAR